VAPVPAPHRLFLSGILLLGLAVRLLHYSAISPTAFPQFPVFYTASDLHGTWEWARTILAGDWLGRDTWHPDFRPDLAPRETWYRWWGGKAVFQQSPLYPYFVAGLLAVSDQSLNVVLLVQLFIGALHPAVMFWLASRLFDVRAGLIAAILTAVYGPFIFHQGTLLRDWVPPVLEPGVLLLLIKARRTGRGRDWLLAGMLMGLAVLAKETALLLLPVALIWLMLEYRPAFRQAVGAGAWLFLGALLVLSPLMIRNASVGAPVLSLSNRAAQGLIEGNAPDGFPFGPAHPPSLKGILERSDGRLPAVIVETLRLYDGDWVRFLRHQLVKLGSLMDPFEMPNNVGFSYGQEISPVLRFTIRYGFIFPLGLAGYLLTLRSGRNPVLLNLYALTTVAGLMVAIIWARYRLVLAPVLIIYGAAALVGFSDTLRSREWAKSASFLAVVLGCAVLQHGVAPVLALRENNEHMLYTPQYHIAARVYASGGEYGRTVSEIVRLRENAKRLGGTESPEQAANNALLEAKYRVQWANQLFDQGKPEQGRRQAEAAQTVYAGHLRASYPPEVVREVPFTLEDPGQARAFFDLLLRLKPDGPEAEAVRRLLTYLKG